LREGTKILVTSLGDSEDYGGIPMHLHSTGDVERYAGRIYLEDHF